MAWTVNRATGQRKAVQWVIAAGGKVEYDFQREADGTLIKDAKPPGPRWLRERIGLDYFANVTKAWISVPKRDETSPANHRATSYSHDSQISDIAPLANLKHLEHLTLSNTNVRDLSPLQGLTKLRWLRLTGSQVTDLSPLRGSNLKDLYLEHTPIRDLTSLQGLDRLMVLNLEGTQVTDLSPLEECSNLRVLFLQDTPISDLSTLMGLKGLKILEINDRQITSDEAYALSTKLNCDVHRRSPVTNHERGVRISDLKLQDE